MLIAEHFVLVALDPASGEVRPNLAQAHRQRFLAATLLMELAVQTRLGLRDDVVVVLDALPSRHPLLTACLQLVRPLSGQLTPTEMLGRATRQLPNLREELLGALVRRDVLHPPRRRFRWFGPKRYPVRSMQAQNESLDRLHRAATGAETDLLSIAFLMLAQSSGLARQLLLPEEANEAATRVDVLRQEIRLDLSLNAEWLDEHYSVALVDALAAALDVTRD